MDKQELERRLEAAEKQNLGLMDEIKNLKAKLADMQDEPEIPDFPEFEGRGDYWYASENLNGIEFGRIVGNIADDYNSFHTKEMAQEFAKKCKLIAMMLHCKWYLDRDNVPDWNNRNEMKSIPIFDHCEHKFVPGTWQFVDNNGVCFSTRENAQKCADWLNEHWKENTDE